MPTDDKRPSKRSFNRAHKTKEIKDYTLAKWMIENFSTFTEHY